MATSKSKVDSGDTKEVVVDEVKGSVPVFIDTTPEEVVELDDRGYGIVFQPLNMCILPDAVAKGLCKLNKDSYFTALASYRQQKKHEADPAPDVKVLGNVLGNSARGKLSRLPASTKAVHRKWIRPDELDEYKDGGYDLVLRNGERYEINARGKVDLVGVEGPMALHKNKVRAASAESRERRTAVDGNLTNKLKSIHPRVKVISQEED